MPGRNDPCPCGSGRKYKKCHLEEDSSTTRTPRESSVKARASRCSALDRNVMRAIYTSEVGRFGSPPADVVELPHDLLFHYAAYVWRREGQTMAEAYLETGAAELEPEELTWLRLQMEAYYTIFSVERVERPFVTVHDVLAGVDHVIGDEALAATTAPGKLFLGRLVEWEGEPFVVSADLDMLPATDLKLVRSRAGAADDEPLTTARLRSEKFAWRLIRAWLDTVQEAVEATEGEE